MTNTNWKILGHLVNTQTEEWFHYDNYYQLWTCDCKEKKESLCLSICDCLKEEGDLRKIKSEINQLRKELGYLQKEIKPIYD